MLRRIRLATLLLVVSLPPVAGANVIIQYFESKWDSIERRMPDVFVAGYSAMWIPPPFRADTGAGSVGYDVYDRFNLGTPNGPTLYGTESTFKSLIREAHLADVSVFPDLVMNHNGFRDQTTPGFAASGGYPGFAVTLPEDANGDFHPAGASGVLDMRLAGLIDIAQEKNWVYIRQPATSGPNNLPNAIISTNNRKFYPDLALPTNGLGIHPFNTADPTAGDPVAENATGVLLRHTQWMLDVVQVDGFRIDAAKHMPQWYFDSFWDGICYQRGRPLLDGSPSTPFSFSEVFDGDPGLLASYIRKDGFGNRDVIDFPLYFAIQSELSGAGLGSWLNIINNTIDASDGSATDGTRGVSVVSSHDNSPPGDDNLGYAFILTKTGYPLVYYNAGEFGVRSFPKAGRGDALGGQYGTLLTTLLDIHTEYARDFLFTRYIDNDILIFERDDCLLVALNDNSDISLTRFDQRVVDTDFDPGARLHELTGNAADPAIDPTNDIDEVLIVGPDKKVTIRIPRNINRKGFVAYGPARPAGAVTLTPTSGVIPADPPETPAPRRRLTAVPIVNSNVFNITLQTTDADPLDPDKDDNAVFKIDGGGDFNGNSVVDILGGVAYGCEQFTTIHSPLFGGGTGTYVQQITANALDEGMHYLKVIAFRHRTRGGPIFESFRVPFYLDRSPPALAIDAPTNTGVNDITTRFTRIRAHRLDRTVIRMHAIIDQSLALSDAQAIALCNDGNRMTRTDSDTFEFLWNLIDSGCHSVFVVAFEDSGNTSVARRVGIKANNGFGGGAGDVNADGFLNNFDIDPFVTILLAGVHNWRADCNCDGYMNNFDIDAFVSLVLGGP